MAHHQQSHAPAPATTETVQPDVINFGAIIGFAAGLSLLIAVVGVIVYVFFGALDRHNAVQPRTEFPLAKQQENREPPEPRLQTNPREDLRVLREGEREILTTYGWVDRNAGVVRIPIDQAMKLTVQRGLLARQERK